MRTMLAMSAAEASLPRNSEREHHVAQARGEAFPLGESAAGEISRPPVHGGELSRLAPRRRQPCH